MKIRLRHILLQATLAVPLLALPAMPAMAADICYDLMGGPSSEVQLRERICRLVNYERQRRGLRPVRLDATLSKVSERYAQKMAQGHFFSHVAPNGERMTDRLRAAGASYSTAGENIAKGQRTADHVMKSWMASPGHRRNILNGKFGKIGAGAFGVNWVQNFTN